MSLARRLGVTDPPVSFGSTASPSLATPRSTSSRTRSKSSSGKAKAAQERSGVPRSAIYEQAVAAILADPKNRPAGANELEDPRTVWKVPVGSSAIRGRPTALVTIVEFSEFDCPYLQASRGHAGEDPERVRRQGPPGLEKTSRSPRTRARSRRRTSRARPAHRRATQRLLGTCTARLFTAPKFDDGDLELSVAKNAGLEFRSGEWPRFAATATGAQIDADVDLADDVEVFAASPHFFVNGRRLVGVQPYEKFKPILDEEVKKAEALLRGGIAATSLYDWMIKDGRTGEPVQRAVPSNPNAPTRGASNAPVLIQEFCDFQSSSAGASSPPSEELLKAFPGKVRHRVARPPAHVACRRAARRGGRARGARAEEGQRRLLQDARQAVRQSVST